MEYPAPTHPAASERHLCFVPSRSLRKDSVETRGRKLIRSRISRQACEPGERKSGSAYGENAYRKEALAEPLLKNSSDRASQAERT